MPLGQLLAIYTYIKIRGKKKTTEQNCLTIKKKQQQTLKVCKEKILLLAS